MSRPTTKEELLLAIQKDHQALQKQLDTLSPDEMTMMCENGWSVKDVLAHLAEWEQMCLGWYWQGVRGETPSTPADGYNWRELPALNQYILAKHRARPLEEILAWFQASYKETLETVQGIPQAELFTAGVYAWTGKNLLAAYFTGSTSSHYLWGRKEIRKIIKG